MIRLAIIADSEFLRTGVRIALEAGGDMAVVGEFAHTAVVAAAQCKPDAVLVDMQWPDANRGVETCRQLRHQSPESRVLMLSPTISDSAAFAAILAGASGQISVNASPAELAHAVQLVVNGGSYFEGEIVERVISRLQAADHAGVKNPEWERLSSRERMILQLLATGLSNREIGEGLNLAASTVRNNITRIRTKLGLRSRTKLVRFAYEHGLMAGSSDDLPLSTGP